MSSPTPKAPSSMQTLWNTLLERHACEQLESLSGWRLMGHELEPGRLELSFGHEGQGDAPAVVLRLLPHRQKGAAAWQGERFDVVVPGKGGSGEARTFVELAGPFLLAAGEGRPRTAKQKKLPVVKEVPVSRKEGTKADRLELFISDQCNIACAFCWESERNARHRFMPFPTITQHLDRAAARGVELVTWLGGEATAHPQFLEAVAYARDKGLKNYLITNLLAFSSARFAKVASSYLDELMISMHAFGQEGGVRVVGRQGWWATFQRALENVREHYRGPLQGSTVVTRYNVNDLERIADVMLSFAPRIWVMGNPVPSGDGKSRFAELALTLTEQRALVPRYAALAERSQAVGTQLLLFCMPHCVVGPELAAMTHDQFMDEMDLANDDRWDESVNVWPFAEAVTDIQPIRLARVKPSVCQPCTRRRQCGGYFVHYFHQHGIEELTPYLG
jgi:MoaA/NifB/PqqE/SkfB family radical SAM enzyme